MYPVVQKAKDGIGNILKKRKMDKQKQRIFAIANTLQQNTQLAKEKYKELIEVRDDVRKYLDCLEKEEFKKEIATIESFDKISQDQKDKLIKHLVEVKDRGIQELRPVIENSQLLQANLLVTLNKVQVQRAIIISKGKLLNNATLQLDTIDLMEDQSRRINTELKQALTRLVTLNRNALGALADTQEALDTSTDVVDVIEGKFKEI